MKRTNYKQYTSFTLAEVLITLTIIGVVAAITIPSLMQSTQNAENVAKVKKAYSTLSAAYQRAVVDNGSPDGWGWTGGNSPVGAQNVLNILAPYLNITNNCGLSTGCFPNVRYVWINKTNDAYYYNYADRAKAQLADGSIIAILARSSNCHDIDYNRGPTPILNNVCGAVYVDINGTKPPNQWGEDFFLFYISKYGIIPVGTTDETSYTPANCDKNYAGVNPGAACAAWVIQKGNMDYLK